VKSSPIGGEFLGRSVVEHERHRSHIIWSKLVDRSVRQFLGRLGEKWIRAATPFVEVNHDDSAIGNPIRLNIKRRSIDPRRRRHRRIGNLDELASNDGLRNTVLKNREVAGSEVCDWTSAAV
jgi:hypothetical protein